MSVDAILKHIVYINLDEREDRRNHFLQEIAKLRLKGPQPHRIAATKLEEGAIGCSISHIKALEHAKKQGWPQVLICEDDITFMNPETFLLSLSKTLYRERSESGGNALWDVLLIAANNWPPFSQQYDNCIRIRNACSATGYIVRQHYYDILLQNYREGVKLFMENRDKKHLYAVDVWWKRLQVRDRWWMVIPATVTQWEQNYSNIEGTMVSYSHLMLQHDKTGNWMPQEKRWMNLDSGTKAGVLQEAKAWLGSRPVVPLMSLHGKLRKDKTKKAQMGMITSA